MAEYREVPCRYYISFGQCSKGKKAEHNRLCQHCAKYIPRAKVRKINKKKIFKYNAGKNDGRYAI